jgi:hypothetical protein
LETKITIYIFNPQGYSLIPNEVLNRQIERIKEIE